MGHPADGFNSCVGCHGREEDLNTSPTGAENRGAGLRQHHENANAASCGTCHSDNLPANFTPVGENVPAARNAALGIDPCNDTVFGIFGSDNDGDNLYDGEDLDDCRGIAFVSQFGQCNGNTPCYTSINTAIASEPTDTEVRISAEDYPEAVGLTTDKGLKLSGGWTTDFVSQSSVTTIDTLTIQNGTLVTENIVMDGASP